MEDTVGCKDRILLNETLRAVWSSPTSSNQTTGCFSLSQHSAPSTSSRFCPSTLFLSFFHSLTLSGKKGLGSLLISSTMLPLRHRKKNGDEEFHICGDPNRRSMSTYTTTLTRIYCCVAGRILRIFFFCNERLLFLLITIAKWFVVHQSLWCIHLIIMMMIFFFHGFPDAFASTMQPWPKPWSAVTCWDTNVSNKERSNYLILALSFIFFSLRSLIRLFTKSFDSIISHIGSFWLGTCHCHQFPWPDLLYY